MSATFPPSRHPASQRGFTLIELAVALGMSTIVGALVFSVFAAQNRVYRQQEDLGRTQNNLRVGMELVTRDLALAGHGASRDGTFVGASGHAGDVDLALFTLTIRDSHDSPSGGPDALSLSYMDPDHSNWGVTTDAETLTCATDHITYRSSHSALVTDFDVGDLIACFDPGGAAHGPRGFVWTVTGPGTPGTGQIPVLTNNQVDYLEKCPLNANLPREMICGELRTVSYYVDSLSGNDVPGSPTIPILMRSSALSFPQVDDVPVAIGVEDLQFEICRGAEDCRAFPSLATGSFDPTVSLLEFEELGLVRVLMTARSVRQSQIKTQASARLDLTTADSYTPSTTPDPYHRRHAARDVLLRNAKSNWVLQNHF